MDASHKAGTGAMVVWDGELRSVTRVTGRGGSGRRTRTATATSSRAGTVTAPVGNGTCWAPGRKEIFFFI